MTQDEILKKVKYGLEISSELPDLEFKTSASNVMIFGELFLLLQTVEVVVLLFLVLVKKKIK